MAAGYRSQFLRKYANEWARKHNTSIETHIRSYRFYIEFKRASDITLFALEWPHYSTNTSWNTFTQVSTIPDRT